MSEDGAGKGSLFDRLKRGLSREPEKANMNDAERRAQNLADELNKSITESIPYKQYGGNSPIQWAVRTSMKEIENFGAIDDVIGQLNDDELSALSRSTGLSKDELKGRYKQKGDQADRDSVNSAYVIVECNIDHYLIDNGPELAKAFLTAVERGVKRERPDAVELITDEFAYLTRGDELDDHGVLFEKKYIFASR